MFGLFGKKKTPPPDATPVDPREWALRRIVPVVRSIEHGPYRAIADDPAAEAVPVSTPFVADLVVLYAEGTDRGSGHISYQRMEELGLTAQTLHELALRNLPNHVSRIRLNGVLPRFMIDCGGNLEASLLLYDRFWSDLADNLPGNPMAAVPARDLLFVTGSEWGGAYQHLSEVVRRRLEPEREPLSRQVLLRRDGTWIAVRLAS